VALVHKVNSVQKNSAPLQNLGITYDELLFYIKHHKTGNYFVIVAGALYAYDFILTLDEEIDFAWSTRKWWQDGARAVFILNRYAPFGLIGTGLFFNASVSDIPPFAPSQEACRLPPVIMLLSLVTFASVEVIFMFRVWILWEKSRAIGTLLIVVLSILVCFGVAVGLFHLNLKFFLPLAQFPSTILVGCELSENQGKGAYIYVLGAIIECISFSLLVSRVWTTSRSGPIVSALIRHGALYYSIAFFGFILAIISSTMAELNFPLLRANVMIVMSSVSCNHLMIGLRRIDGSLAGGVTEIDEWEARPRSTTDLTTSFANDLLAHTRDIDSSPWDVEMTSRRSRIDAG